MLARRVSSLLLSVSLLLVPVGFIQQSILAEQAAGPQAGLKTTYLTNDGVSGWPLVAAAGSYVHVFWFNVQMNEEDAETDVIYYSRSTDQGNSFADPVMLMEYPGFIFHDRIIINGPDIYLLAFQMNKEDHEYSEAFLIRSTDYGATFPEPTRIENVHHGATLSVSRAHAYLIGPEETGEDSRMFLMTSEDRGATFGGKQRFGIEIMEGYDLTVSGMALDPQTTAGLAISWQNKGSSIVHTVVSDDGGINFSEIRDLDLGSANGGWTHAYDNEGNYYIIWHSKEGLKVARSADDGRTFRVQEIGGISPSAQINFVRAEGDSLLVFWDDENRNDDSSFFARINSGDSFDVETTTIDEPTGFNQPVISGDMMVFGWDKRNLDVDEGYITMSTDGGLSFNPPLKIGTLSDLSNSFSLAVSDDFVYVAGMTEEGTRQNGTLPVSDVYIIRIDPSEANQTPSDDTEQGNDGPGSEVGGIYDWIKSDATLTYSIETETLVGGAEGTTTLKILSVDEDGFTFERTTTQQKHGLIAQDEPGLQTSREVITERFSVRDEFSRLSEGQVQSILRGDRFTDAETSQIFVPGKAELCSPDDDCLHIDGFPGNYRSILLESTSSDSWMLVNPDTGIILDVHAEAEGAGFANVRLIETNIDLSTAISESSDVSVTPAVMERAKWIGVWPEAGIWTDTPLCYDLKDNGYRKWADNEKEIAKRAISRWNDSWALGGIVKGRQAIPADDQKCFNRAVDVTLQWAGDNLFRKWTDYTDLSLKSGYYIAPEPCIPSCSQILKDITDPSIGEFNIYFNVNENFPLVTYFFDPTPETDEEFVNGAAPADSPAYRKLDFMTLVGHEFGHALGRGHDPFNKDSIMYETTDEGSRIMAQSFAEPGIRRHPTAADLEALQVMYTELDPKLNPELKGSSPAEAQSGETTENQKPSGCLIATAAFGSDFAPQVQFLREFRDQRILATQSGSSFMVAFNAWYYSFSPYVADYERQNPIFQNVVRIALQPLLGILAISEKAFTVTGTGDHSAVLAGMTSAPLIGLVYFWPAALPVFLKARRRIVGKIIIIAFGASILSVSAGLALSSELWLSVSTSMLILVSLFAGAYASAGLICKGAKMASHYAKREAETGHIAS